MGGQWRLSRSTSNVIEPAAPDESHITPSRYACLLFMLVSALMGLERVKDSYAFAIENGYHFYSYGDASLLPP